MADVAAPAPANSRHRPSQTQQRQQPSKPQKAQQRRLTESEASSLRVEGRSALLRDARSHGPYLWTAGDVRNALLWFDGACCDGTACRCSDARGSSEAGGPPASPGSDDDDDNKEEEEEASAPSGSASSCPNVLLRSLLHSRGVFEDRPAKRRGHKKRPRGDGNAGDGGAIEGETATMKLRRLAEEAKRGRRVGSDNAPILREVLLGYAAAGAGASGAPAGGAGEGARPRASASAAPEPGKDNRPAAAAEAEPSESQSPPSPPPSASCSALGRLKSDLTEIAASRSLTSELHDLLSSSSAAAASSLASSGSPTETLSASRNSNQASTEELLRLSVLDESESYFRSPGAAVGVAYASQLYDRLLALQSSQRAHLDQNQTGRERAPEEEEEVAGSGAGAGGGDGEVREGGAARGKSSGADAGKGAITREARHLLRKLRSLAVDGDGDGRIAEVSVLMLLEPLRRLRRRRGLQGGGLHVGSSASSPVAAIIGAEADDDDEEEVCSTDLCRAMLGSVLETAAEAEKKAGGGRGGMNDEGGGVGVIWSLPSPLLCAASHAYFPLAAAYVHHLLGAALEAYRDVPRLVARRVSEAMQGNLSCGDDNDERGPMVGDDNVGIRRTAATQSDEGVRINDPSGRFDACVRRVLCMYGTSERLSELVCGVLETEVETARETLDCSRRDESDDSNLQLHQRLIVLDTIQRHIASRAARVKLS